MGCCTSKPRKTGPARPEPDINKSASARRHVAPPPEEEPVVKEVLSETPKPVVTRIPTRLITRPDSNIPSKPISEITRIVKPISEISKKPPIKPESADVSEPSEVSVSTVPDEEFSGEVRRKVTGSPANTQTRYCSGRVRETGPSPGRARSVPGRERNADRVRERNPGRREMYCGRGGGGRLNGSPSVKRSCGKSVVKIASDDSYNKAASNNVTRKIEGPVGEDESLENPLVSLECFIFL